MKFLLAVILGPLLLAPRTALLASDPPPAAGRPVAWVVVQPKENPVAFRNPLKGWRGVIDLHGWGGKPIDDTGSHPIGSDLESLRKWYVSWDRVESSGTDGVEKLQAATDRVLADFPARNMKAVPRLELLNKDGTEVPADLPALTNPRACAWYLLPAVRPRIERLIARAGQVWDHDPRIAYVEMGVVGKYGEQWDLGKFPEIEHYLHAAYARAFKNKPVLIRGAGANAFSPSLELAEAGPYGFFEDSFGVPVYEQETLLMGEMDGDQRWQAAPIGGESNLLAYDDDPWRQEKGRHDFVLPSPKAGKVAVPSLFASAGRLDYFVDLIRQAHVNFLGSAQGTQLEGQSPAGIATVQRSLGYRFIVTEARFPNRVEPGESLTVRLQVKNAGPSPIYGRWNLAVCLADPTTHQPVWTGILNDVDPRAWLPGRRYDAKQRIYTVPAASYAVEGALPLPPGLARGDYALALGILDAEGGGLPTVRFAIDNYWQGGLHPLGIIGIGRPPEGSLDPATFFRDGVDPALHYTVHRTSPATGRQATEN